MSGKQSTFFPQIFDEELGLLKKEVSEIKQQTQQNSVDITELKEFKSKITKEVVVMKEEHTDAQQRIDTLQTKVDVLMQSRFKQLAFIVCVAIFLIYTLHHLL